MKNCEVCGLSCGILGDTGLCIVCESLRFHELFDEAGNLVSQPDPIRFEALINCVDAALPDDELTYLELTNDDNY